MRIIEHPLFVEKLNQIEELEKNRIYCGHDYTHLTDVARITYIYALEAQKDVSRDVIYAAALLHDIGRADEYENGVPHEQAGIELARIILKDCDYADADIAVILQAIGEHRGEAASELGTLLKKADKKSRACWRCSAASTCKWPVKNEGIEI